MSQNVRHIQLKDLVLWSENPRDPIDSRASNQKIVDRALKEHRSKWSLPKLASEMGHHYDHSELPTVVYKNDKPVVYDGNRRVALGLIKHGYVVVDGADISSLPEFPLSLPCNVCSEDIAIENIFRKHSKSGSWKPLERDLFVSKYMHAQKSPFLLLDESTGLVRNHALLNRGFVRDEVFTESNLKGLGFHVVNGKLHSVHTDPESQVILNDIIQKIKNGDINTRTASRRKPTAVLGSAARAIVTKNRDKKPRTAALALGSGTAVITSTQKRSPRTRDADQLFGGVIYLVKGPVNDLHRDISDLWEYYIKNRTSLSGYFPALVRMSLRLLCEGAATDAGYSKIDPYIQNRFKAAKASLNAQQKTELHTNNVTESSIISLLHIGAHNYKAAANLQQTIAMSWIVGKILEMSHGQT